VSPFLKHAEEIFTTACQGGAEDCEWALLVGGDGAIRMVAGSGWRLEPLRAHHGARAAYRVTRKSGRVRVEARSSGESCLLESSQAAVAVRPALRDFPQYVVA